MSRRMSDRLSGGGPRSSPLTCWPASWHGGGVNIIIATTGSSETRGAPAANPTEPAIPAFARAASSQPGKVMHQTLHDERHFTASELVRDIVIGMSDGLTVPFALAAGLSGTAIVTT